MELHQKSRTSLRNILDICFKRKGQIIIFFLATVCTVAIGVFVSKSVYRAQAQILVKVGRENIYVPASGNLSPMIRVDRKEKINSAIEILKSPSLIEKTVLTLGPTVLYPDIKDTDPNGLIASIKKTKSKVTMKVKRLLSGRQNMGTPLGASEKALNDTILKFSDNLKIEGIRDSTIINISFKNEDPRIAAKALNHLATSYLEHYLKVYKTGKSNNFYLRQVDFLKEKLKQNEEKLINLKTRHNITSLDEQQHLLLNKASELRSDLNKTLSQRTETRNRIIELRKQLVRVPETIPQEAEAVDNPYLISTLEARLVELQLEEKKLLTKYTDDSRLVQNVKAEIGMVQKKLEEQEDKRYKRSRSGVNVTHQTVQSELLRNEAELTALKAKARAQRSQFEEYQKELGNLDKIEAHYKRLMQEIKLDQNNYQNYLNKLEDSRISEAMDDAKITSVSLIELAKPPLEPISPKRALILLISIVLGIFGGLGLAFFMEYLNENLERPEDIEQFLNTPVLTSIPKLN